MAFVPLLVRLGTGGFLVLVGLGKFVDHASEVRDFRGFGVPLPEFAVPLAGVIEVGGGQLIIAGFLTRPAAALVIANLLVALLTAGVNEGGSFHLVVGPTLILLLTYLVVFGGGSVSFDTRVSESRARPGTRR